jgi:hypothetical protein
MGAEAVGKTPDLNRGQAGLLQRVLWERSTLCVPEVWSILIPRRNRVTWRDNDRAAHLYLEAAIATK